MPDTASMTRLRIEWMDTGVAHMFTIEADQRMDLAYFTKWTEERQLIHVLGGLKQEIAEAEAPEHGHPRHAHAAACRIIWREMMGTLESCVAARPPRSSPMITVRRL